MTPAEFLELARATERFETLTLVLGHCGLRFGETAALRRENVGDRELTRSSATSVTGAGIVETATKTNRVRHVPVPEPVWERHADRRAGLVEADLVPNGLRHTTASLAIGGALMSRSCRGFSDTPRRP
ncbi:hypothetical protein MSHI_09440 [Mycobacterium shinjukuense]|uniref:Uncharacterized protein n=1 Tax=Mycobacterium shinjukuense TaxID=398694 RepID=A0A7I7MLC0_9MYCO|nr:hypothetical protein MSHI_09440 [Mycobacterium shinjukuense]